MRNAAAVAETYKDEPIEFPRTPIPFAEKATLPERDQAPRVATRPQRIEVAQAETPPDGAMQPFG